MNQLTPGLHRTGTDDLIDAGEVAKYRVDRIAGARSRNRDEIMWTSSQNNVTPTGFKELGQMTSATVFEGVNQYLCLEVD